jgi:hypothetical protein
MEGTPRVRSPSVTIQRKGRSAGARAMRRRFSPAAMSSTPSAPWETSPLTRHARRLWTNSSSTTSTKIVSDIMRARPVDLARPKSASGSVSIDQLAPAAVAQDLGRHSDNELELAAIVGATLRLRVRGRSLAGCWLLRHGPRRHHNDARQRRRHSGRGFWLGLGMSVASQQEGAESQGNSGLHCSTPIRANSITCLRHQPDLTAAKRHLARISPLAGSPAQYKHDPGRRDPYAKSNLRPVAPATQCRPPAYQDNSILWSVLALTTSAPQ